VSEKEISDSGPESSIQLKYTHFNVGQKVVYSSHGVGEIIAIETNTYAGVELIFYVINLINQKMSIKVPANKTGESGLRPIVSDTDAEGIYQILKTKSCQLFYKSKAKKFTDYKQKLNSGNVVDLAEVVRDLHKSDCVNTSYSQKAIYESALNRLANELALLKNIQLDQMLLSLEEILTARA
jgi:CarD family transcriptional regulator